MAREGGAGQQGKRPVRRGDAARPAPGASSSRGSAPRGRDGERSGSDRGASRGRAGEGRPGERRPAGSAPRGREGERSGSDRGATRGRAGVDRPTERRTGTSSRGRDSERPGSKRGSSRSRSDESRPTDRRSSGPSRGRDGERAGIDRGPARGRASADRPTERRTGTSSRGRDTERPGSERGPSRSRSGESRPTDRRSSGPSRGRDGERSGIDRGPARGRASDGRGSDRGPSRGSTGSSSRGRSSEPSAVRRPTTPKPMGPKIDADVSIEMLDRPTQNELRGLDEQVKDLVAGHLVMAGRLLEEDPETALAHATAAASRAARLAVVREACGIAAYAAGSWDHAIRELRTAMRISGSVEFLPLIADCERGLGRPERALEIAGSIEAGRLSQAGRVELRIVAAGARADMGQIDAALVTLKCPELHDAHVHEWSVSLWYAYADMLHHAGRSSEAVEWFAKAAAADDEEETDAALRLQQLLD